MNLRTTLLAVAVAAALGACGNKSDNPMKTSAPANGATSPTVQAAAPAAPADRDTPPAGTPATHAGQPQPEAAGAATARDTPASKPTSDLTPAEESKAMPKPGQTDNHFTPSLDGDLKGTQQSPGTPPPAAPGAPSIGSATSPTTAAPTK
jgi:hypothetical protein